MAGSKGKRTKKVVKRSRSAKPAQAAAPAREYPCQAHVLKGGDRIPVQVTSDEHLARLQSEHGRDAVEV